MNSEKFAQIQTHVQAIATLLYEEAQRTAREKFETLEGYETTVRGQLLEYVSPANSPFFIQSSSDTTAGRARSLNSIHGELKITSKQGTYFEIGPYSRWSPYLEKCCLHLKCQLFIRARQGGY